MQCRDCISIIALEGVLAKSLDSSSKGTKTLLSDVLGWVSNISIKGMAASIGFLSFSFSLLNETRT